MLTLPSTTKNSDDDSDYLLATHHSVLFNQHYQFWSLQIFGWCGYAFMLFVAIIFPQLQTPDFHLNNQLINLFNETVAGFTLSYVQWLIIQRMVTFRFKWTLALSFLSATVLGGIWNLVKLASYKSIVFQQSWYQHWNLLEFGGWLLFSVATMFVWNAIFFIMLYNKKLQQEHELLLRARTAEKEAQLQMMRYQLNPHFMFNSMNAISTLIYRHDNDKANEMLDKLCSFLRYSLEHHSEKFSCLSREIELSELYLSIEKVRFAERLAVEINMPLELLNAKVPSLVLQPVIENAIKHGIETCPSQGKICISGERINNTLVIKVTNSGGRQTNQQKIGFGIGLSNIRERINTLFDGEGSVTLRTNDDNSTLVALNMPFIVNDLKEKTL